MVASALLPHLVPACYATPISQPCFVPFAARPKVSKDQRGKEGIFIVNTPDQAIKRNLSDNDMQEHSQHLDLTELTRRNHNLFAAVFVDRVTPRNHSSNDIVLPHAVTKVPSILGVTAQVSTRRPPRLFVCDARTLDINHSTVTERICADHFRNSTISCRIYRQKLNDKDARVRYILRFPEHGPEPWVQRFYLPLDARGGGTVWGVFDPIVTHFKCLFCGRRCHTPSKFECPYTTEIGTTVMTYA